MRPDSTALAGTLVGAGTVLDAQQPVLAIEAGARFLACPALSAEVIRAARRHGGAGHGRGRDTLAVSRQAGVPPCVSAGPVARPSLRGASSAPAPMASPFVSCAMP
ncbi:hypothetical protein AB0J63_40335 [Streptosporangium canum]|uniref:hypothetical protein n=1 Tax=Streptosporangium canum TaxID=324952 RepID=UPI0034340462